MITRLNMGGAAHHVALLSGRRFPDRYEALLVHGALAPGEASLAQVAEREGAEMLYMPELVPAIRPEHDVRALARLRSLIRDYRPDVLCTHTAKAGFLARQAALLAGERRPVLVHTFHGHVLEGYFGPLKSGLYRGLERRLGRRTDALIGVSRATVGDLVRLGVAPEARFRVIPHGLELEYLAAIDDWDRRRARDELGIDADEIVCTFVGRIVPIKRVDLLIDAFGVARRSDPRLRLLLVGDGDDRGRLEARAERLGLRQATDFLGYREDLASIWAATDIAMLTSANEGLPVSLIEAGAAGVPAVATDVGGVGEAMTGDGALLVPSGDAGAIAGAVCQLAANPRGRRQMGSSAREHALARFTAGRLIADMDALYGDLLAKSGASGRGMAGVSRDAARTVIV